MRLAGKLDDQHHAATLIDYLLTQGVAAKVERQADGWELWIYDEDQLARGRDELASFKAEPEAERYRNAGREAERVRREKADKEIEARRNIIRNLPRAPRVNRPLTMVLLAGMTVVFVASEFGNDGRFLRPFFLERARIVNGHEQWGQPLESTLREEPWRLFTPMFVHHNIWHFILNTMALLSFGTAIESLRGSWRYALMILFFASVAHLTQNWWDRRHAEIALVGGMSGVVYGMFGYIWMKAWNEPSSGFYITDRTIILMHVWHLICMSGALGLVANAAHVAGQIAGMAAGLAPTLLRGSLPKR